MHRSAVYSLDSAYVTFAARIFVMEQRDDWLNELTCIIWSRNRFDCNLEV